MTRGLMRTVAAPAFFALLLQGFVGGGLGCGQADVGQDSVGTSHSAMHMDSGMDTTTDGAVGAQHDGPNHQDPCATLGHCAASLATHPRVSIVEFSHRAPAPAFPGWILHGAPEFGLTPPPKV